MAKRRRKTRVTPVNSCTVVNSVDQEKLIAFAQGDDGDALDPLSDTFAPSLIAADFSE